MKAIDAHSLIVAIKVLDKEAKRLHEALKATEKPEPFMLSCIQDIDKAEFNLADIYEDICKKYDDLPEYEELLKSGWYEG